MEVECLVGTITVGLVGAEDESMVEEMAVIMITAMMMGIAVGCLVAMREDGRERKRKEVVRISILEKVVKVVKVAAVRVMRWAGDDDGAITTPLVAPRHRRIPLSAPVVVAIHTTTPVRHPTPCTHAPPPPSPIQNVVRPFGAAVPVAQVIVNTRGGQAVVPPRRN